MDEIVSACQFRDKVLVFTRKGYIYEVYYDEVTGQVTFQLLAGIFLR